MKSNVIAKKWQGSSMLDNPESRNREKRDRHSTQDAIMAAFESVLLRDGVAGLGVNAVAQEAGINKVLIYRYFGDLPGLARRWSASSSFWPSEQELIGNDPAAFARLSVEDRVRKVMRNYLDAIRARPLTVELLAAELMNPTDITRALADGMAKPGTAVGDFTRLNEADRDLTEQVWKLTMLVNMITAYLAIRQRSNPMYFGHDLTEDESWAFFRDTVDELTARFLLP